MNRVIFKSQSVHWPTPLALYKTLDSEFNFNYDPCPLHGSSGGLIFEDWVDKRVFCNPPYGPEIGMWIKRATVTELAVYLLPARTDTRWFHDLVIPLASEVRFIKGRLNFGDSKKDAPFPSMIVIYRRGVLCTPSR